MVGGEVRPGERQGENNFIECVIILLRFTVIGSEDGKLIYCFHLHYPMTS